MSYTMYKRGELSGMGKCPGGGKYVRGNMCKEIANGGRSTANVNLLLWAT